jgi:hypothetical protein
VIGRHFLSVQQLLLRLLLVAALPAGFLGRAGIALIVAGSEKSQSILRISHITDVTTGEARRGLRR